MKRTVLSLVGGVLAVSGATWLAWFFWESTQLGYTAYGPPILGALLASITIGGVVDRRQVRSAVVAVAVTLAIYTVLAVAVAPPIWVLVSPSPAPSAGYYVIAGAAAVAVAALGASIPRLVRRTDGRVLWLWISALMTLGAIGLVILGTDEGRGRGRSGGLFITMMLASPVIAGAVTQAIARRRMTWICGGGALIFMLLALNRMFHGHGAGGLVGALFAVGMFVLLGALGARIGWRLFRRGDPPEPSPVELPTARTT